MHIQLHLLALAGYALAGALVAAPLLRLRARGGATLPLVACASAVALHFGALIAYAREAGAFPFSGVGPALSSLGFLVALLASGIQWLTRERAIALVATPLVVVLLVAALLVGLGNAPAPGVAARSAWFVLHAATSFLGIALLAVAFAASALYMVQYRELKARRFGAIFQLFPPLEQLDRLNRVALAAGFPTLTLGIVLAVADLGLGSGSGGLGPGHLGWGMLSWLLLGGVAAARLSGRLHGRRAAIGSIVAFIAIALVYVLLSLVEQNASRFL